jgi:hypothetical protein
MNRMVRRWRIAAPYRLHLRTCRHPGFTPYRSRLRRHPDGRGKSYERCAQCRRLTWRAWERWPFNEPAWRKVLYRAQAKWRLRGRSF